jgi:hypothetical protein
MRTREPSPDQIQLWSTQSASKHSHRIALLIPIVRTLALKAGDSGVTISDVRLTAVQRGLLAAEAKGRELSFLGALCRMAGLIATERTRRSTIDASHGNRHSVWVLPADQRRTA